jgi:hypothetical protein
VVLLPSLVFGAKIEGSGVLQVRWEDDCLIAGFAGKLNSKIPAVEGDEGEVEWLWDEMLGGKGIESVYRIPEGTCIANVFPGKCCQARAERRNWSIDGLDQHAFPMELFAALCIQENPTKLYDLCRVFSDINSMLIAGSGNVNNHVSVKIDLLALCIRRHIYGVDCGSRDRFVEIEIEVVVVVED